MKLEYKRLLLAVMGIFLAGATRAPVVDVDEVSRAVGVCANATSKLGVDDQPFKTGAWTMETVDGLPGDRFYSKGDLRASLGTRPGVGGSCIISINVRSSYDLTPLTRALERAFNVKALVSSPTFALLPLPEKVLQGRVAPTPVGSVVSVAVEMGP
jgi:hypothetical protein